ncbi:MAG: topology modulation protein [Oscillospiraceae bacterium]|nr:topology modulation protein [Oscillospiraceae bacterium]
MKRILVIGGNGSGKSTFSKKLGEKTGLPVVHLDKIFWHGNWEYISREKFDILLDSELKKESWIIDGNFERTLEKRVQYCDTVFYFDFSTIRCLFGVTERVLKNYGRTRADMGGNCPEKFDLEFYKAILRFNKKNRPKTKTILEKYNPDVIVFKNRKQAENYLNSL